MKNKRTDQEFLQQLIGLLAAEGIRTLTIAEIARRLQCSRRRIYDLAATKEELFLVATRHLLDSTLNAGRAAAGAETDVTRGIAAYLQVGVIAAGHLSKAYLDDLESTAAGRKLMDHYQTLRAQGLKELLQAGIEQGVFAPQNPMVISEALLGAAQRIRRPRFLAAAGLTREQAFNELYRVILDGLLLQPQSQRAERSGRNGARPAAAAPGIGEPVPAAPGLSTAETQRDDVERALDQIFRR